MINNDDTNAFPFPISANGIAEPDQSGGMTLRDYFAAKAMQGALTTSGAPWLSPDKSCADSLARMAYEVADSMLEARKS